MLDAPGLLFYGEPGIGKSRLAAEAADLAKRCAGEVVELAGSPYHAEVGLHPVRALLERRCGISRGTDPDERLRLLEAELATGAGSGSHAADAGTGVGDRPRAWL
jgi:hypothetical protein